MRQEQHVHVCKRTNSKTTIHMSGFYNTEMIHYYLHMHKCINQINSSIQASIQFLRDIHFEGNFDSRSVQ